MFLQYPIVRGSCCRVQQAARPPDGYAIISRRKPVMNRNYQSVSVVSAFVACVFAFSSCAHSPSVRTPHVALSGSNADSTDDLFPEDGVAAALDSTGLAEYAGEDDTDVDEETDAEEIFARAQERYERAYEYISDARTEIDTALGLLDEIRDTEDSTTLIQRDEMILEFSQLMRQLGFVEQRGAVSMNGAIPLQINQFVEREIRSFQTVERSWFLRAYQRSGFYVPYIKQRMREAGMPEQLAWLAFIESGYSPRALSPARALGLWQFIPSTGYRYGMRRDRWIDHRMDYERATTAAIGYLSDLHGMFGDWNAALAAYNCGEGRVLRTINSQSNEYLDDFWDLYVRLPQETARYVPRFHAVMAIMEDPAKYGFDLPEPESPIAFDTLMVDRQIRLSDIAQRTGISTDVLTRLNAELRTGVTPQYPYRLRVPVGTLDSVTVAINTAPATSAPNLPDIVTHKVKRRETINTIARKFRTTVTAIRQENGLRKNQRLRVGQVLRIPVRSTEPQSTSARVAPNTAVNDDNPSSGTETTSLVNHRVRRRETVSSIARKYHTTVTAIRRENGLRKTQSLRTGQVIRVPVPARSGQAAASTAAGGNTSQQASRTNDSPRFHVVRSGDTLWSISQRYSLSVDELRRINNLTRRSTIKPGQRLVVSR